MKDRMKVLVADESAGFRSILVDSLQNCDFIDAIYYVSDGQELICHASALKPDVIITEAILPYIDGLSAIRMISNSKPAKQPIFFVTAAFSSDHVMMEAATLGVRHFFRKPFDISALIERVKGCEDMGEWYGTKPVGHTGFGFDIESEVAKTIQGMGVPTNIRGYQYMREAIIAVFDDAEAAFLVTKILYPMVAQKYKTTASRVERSIRHAIEVMWDRGELETLHNMFGYTISDARGRPTNAEFISMVADHLRLKLKEA